MREFFGLRQQFLRRAPGQSRAARRVAVELEVGFGGGGAVGQQHVQTVQHQVRQQLGNFVFGANQTQVRLKDHALQQAAHGRVR